MRYLIPTTLVLIAISSLALTACGGSPNDQDAGATSGQAPQESGIVRQTGRTIVEGAAVTAALIAGDYARDEAFADTKYEGKVIEVVGVVSEFGKSAAEVPYVVLSGIHWFPIQCILPDTETQVPSQAVVGQPATIRGRVEGMQDSVKVEDEDDVFAIFQSFGDQRLTLSGCDLVE